MGEYSSSEGAGSRPGTDGNGKPEFAAREPDARGQRLPVALTVAGFDPSSGAGITADLKTFAAHGVYGMAAITALTVQSTQGVRSVQAVAPALLRETLECLAEDVDFAGVKTGMMGTAGAVRELAAFLRRLLRSGGGRLPVVADPVLRSSSGAELLDRDGLALLRTDLLPLVGWITPNARELALLSGAEVHGVEDIPPAALRLREMARRAGNSRLSILVTGGDLPRPDDFLLGPEATQEGSGLWLRGERVQTRSTHGTGCAFSSALLCGLMAGASPLQAVTAAKDYVAGALRAAWPVGKGHGPMHHLFRRS